MALTEMMDAATCAPSSINSEMTTFPKTGLVNTSPTVFGLFCAFVAFWIPNKCKPACCPPSFTGVSLHFVMGGTDTF
jgi:hypothetical protein